MARYQFELASEADDADLRQILTSTPMEGDIALTFRREPSYFAASVVEGPFRQVVAARDCATNRIIGFGSRSVRMLYVNDAPTPVGYLSSLRLLPGHRNMGLIARGFSYFRELHADGQVDYYLTTIAEGNARALAILTSGRAGLPRYRFLERYFTLAIPFRGRRWRHAWANNRIQVRAAGQSDLPEIVAFVSEWGPRRNFFPAYERQNLFGPESSLHGLSVKNVLLATRGSRIVGLLGVWNQAAFRQTVVEGYRGPLRWLLPAYNLWSRLRGQPALPKAGHSLRYLTAALPIAAGGETAILLELIAHVQQAPELREHDYLLLGLAESDPLCGKARRHASASYATRIYLVAWEGAEEFASRLDGRPLYLELGCL
jgi:hypothetical protein